MTRAETTERALPRIRGRGPVVSPTEIQLAALVIIDAFSKRKGYAPTIRELGAMFGHKSTNATNDLLAALERKRLVLRDAKVARSTRLTKAGKAAVWAHRLRMAAPEVSR